MKLSTQAHYRHCILIAAEEIEEAAEVIGSWGAYASQNFQEKHDLAGDITRFQKVAKKLREKAQS